MRKRLYLFLGIPSAIILLLGVIILFNSEINLNGFTTSQISIQSIPSDRKATEDSVLYDGHRYVARRIKGTKCVCLKDICESKTHECLEWAKEYDKNGRLIYYTTYEIEYVPQNYYVDARNREKRTYLIRFHENGKIHTLGDKSKVQYFDESGNMIKECDSFDDGVAGSRKCQKYENGVWITYQNEWIA